MKCASQIHSIIAGYIGSYIPTLKTAAKNITRVSKTTPYTMTCHHHYSLPLLCEQKYDVKQYTFYLYGQ
jgi:hypothetical protein